MLGHPDEGQIQDQPVVSGCIFLSPPHATGVPCPGGLQDWVGHRWHVLAGQVSCFIDKFWCFIAKSVQWTAQSGCLGRELLQGLGPLASPCRTEATRGAQTDPGSSQGLKAGRKHWGRQQRRKKKSTVVEIAVEAWKINLSTGKSCSGWSRELWFSAGENIQVVWAEQRPEFRRLPTGQGFNQPCGSPDSP